MRAIREHTAWLKLPLGPRRVGTRGVSKIRRAGAGRHNHRSAVAVVTRIVDVLHPSRRVEPAPEMQRVVGFFDGFASIIETAIANKKP